MQLTVDNLEEIHQLLTRSHAKAIAFLESVDLNAEVTPSPERRQLLNEMLDRISRYLLEISHIHSFLQQVDVSKIPLTLPQQKSLMACQELCSQLKGAYDQAIKWIVQMKEHFNQARCPILDEGKLERAFQAMNATSDQIMVSEAMLQTYQQVRDILTGIHSEVIFFDPENMANTAGKRLEVMDGKQLFIETEHEMNVLIDYGLFQYRKNGKNVVERYYDKHHTLYPAQKLVVLQAFKEARFSLLEIIKPVDEHGLMVYDPLRGESLFMIDKGLYQLAKSRPRYALLTHYLQMPDFILTTGASTPVPLDSETGKAMWKIFERLIHHHQQKKTLDHSAYFQNITDLFKMAIHENLTKSVTSRELPMSYHPIELH
jgi:hypothetical protein